LLKAGLVVTGGAALVGRAGPGLAQGRTFPPAPPVTSPIAGRMDTHVHAAPSSVARSTQESSREIDGKPRGLPPRRAGHNATP
jgi:hypothetical protein